MSVDRFACRSSHRGSLTLDHDAETVETREWPRASLALSAPIWAAFVDFMSVVGETRAEVVARGPLFLPVAPSALARAHISPQDRAASAMPVVFPARAPDAQRPSDDRSHHRYLS